MDDHCSEVLHELRRFLDGECDSDLESAVRAHLGDCPGCLDRADFERELKMLIAARCRSKAPPHLVQLVVERIRTTVVEDDLL
ncbi:MAG TPA: mycothiol system anti-sigma-R factor [Egibacteraceae bacterium]|mgnify:CR=1 FL=1